MRSELKKARLAEAKANESKKELVAKLSRHQDACREYQGGFGSGDRACGK